MAKRSIAILSTILIVVFQLSPILRKTVYATDVTVANTFGDIAYGYTSADLLSSENYLDYFDTVDGYLKYCADYWYFPHDNNSDMGSTLWTNIEYDFDNGHYLKDTEFPSVEGYHCTQLYYFDYAPHLCNSVIVSDYDVVIVGGYYISNHPFSIYSYYYDINGAGSQAYTNKTDYGVTEVNQEDAHGYYSIKLSSRLQWTLFSEIPVYLTAYNNTEYPDGYVLISQYDYDDPYIVYLYIDQDTTGFVIDRRTQHMIDNDPSGGDDIDGDLAVIQGSFRNIMGGASLGDMGMITVFELNPYTNSIRNDVKICYDYTFAFSGTINGIPLSFSKSFYDTNGYFDEYTVGSANYLVIDIDEVLSRIRTQPNYSFNQGQETGEDNAINQAFSQVMATADNAEFHQSYSGGFSCLEALDLLQYVGLNSYTTYKQKDFGFDVNAHADIVSKLKWDVGFNLNSTSRTESGIAQHLDYVDLTVNIFLKDTKTNDVSNTYVYKYDFKSNTATMEGGFEEIQYDENNQPVIWDGNYTYGSSIKGNYLNNAIPYDYNITSGTTQGGTGYGGNASIGDINLYCGAGSTGVALFDIPMEEALENTPRLNELYSTMKDGFIISTTNSQSILQLTRDTYTFIPAEIWGYIAITVVTCCGLAVYRNFRGR